ncbi:hypothetical protein FBU59_003661 [Linderina macrospora]|uniref:Uncharacterized protein n=1 Tax=Linderina macrospora TaxID=4868 RepID=A0ACC1J805_9FUNG|nr:hypothetical protein FBU59_003661 [Linderina macrospora]
MCDTIDKDTKNVIRKSSFFRRLRERVHPTKLFDFTDNRTLPADEARDVASFREHIIQRTPMMVCGSSHVAAWQKKRHSKMNKTGSREDRFNWRSVDTPLNSARFAESTIAENIIGPCASDVSDVSGSDDGSSSNNNGRCASNGLASLAAQVTPNDSQESLKSQYTLPTNTDVIQVQRYMQQRDISLVREFDWGNLQLTNPNHCNFALLHDILFRSYREALQAMTNKYFYEDYRKKRLASVPSVTKKSKNQYRYFKQERDSKNVAPLMDPLGYWPGAHGGDQVLNTGDTSAYSNAATDGTGSSHANDDSPAVQTRAQPQFSFSFQLPQGNEFSPFSTLGKTSSPTANFSFSRGMDQRVSDAATLTSHMARLSLGKDVSDTASDRRSSSASSSLRRHRRSTIGASTHQVAF